MTFGKGAESEVAKNNRPVGAKFEALASIGFCLKFSPLPAIAMKKLLVSDLVSIPWNPRSISEEALELLLRSLQEHTAALPEWNPSDGIRLASPITVNRQGNRIIGGHQRIVALQKAGQDWIHPDDFHWVDLPPDSALEKSLVVQLNNRDAQGVFVDALLADVLGSVSEESPELLKSLGLDSLLESTRKGSKVQAATVDAAKTSEEFEALIQKYDKILVQFSGGRDSTVVLNWAQTMSLLKDKPVEAMFVETGAEFPCVTQHVINVCLALQVPLKILNPKKHILQHYVEKGQWPDQIYRDCMHEFIHATTDGYSFSRDERVLVVRGGRNDQQTRISKSKEYFEKEKGGKTIGVLAPYYATSKEEYEAELQKVESLLWKGYSLGFVRTACWNCPFQRHEQWEAMKVHYPLLWEAMRIQATTLKFRKVQKDSTKKSFDAYWTKQKPLEAQGSTSGE